MKPLIRVHGTVAGPAFRRRVDQARTGTAFPSCNGLAARLTHHSEGAAPRGRLDARVELDVTSGTALTLLAGILGLLAERRRHPRADVKA